MRDPIDEALAAADIEADAAEPPITKRKRPRRTRPRSRTIPIRKITREDQRLGALMFPHVDVDRPQTRSDCRGAARPCPFVGCKFHLYLDVNPETGSIKINFPDLEPGDMKDTCALDVAERGGITLEEVGEIMNLTRERIRQVEVRGLLKLKMASPSPDEPGAVLLRPPPPAPPRQRTMPVKIIPVPATVLSPEVALAIVTGESLEWAHPAATPAAPPFAEPTCTACGCTPNNACVHMPTRRTCGWAELDPTNNAGICTACAE